MIGGVAFVALIVFFLWRFWIKKRREQQELEAEEWEDDDIAQQKHVSQFNAVRSDQASTRTRGSLANSILSRASNIIQIAYIPGVTNRNGSGHNSMLANAPVPPIPARYAQTTPKSPLSNEGDALFFRPGSLRGSTYSDGSSVRSGNQRDTQYTRQSITPSLARQSVMSDVYRDDASVEPMPATQVVRAAPRMVSVKQSQASSPSESEMSGGSGNSGHGVKVMVPGESSASATAPKGSGSSFAKATQITVGKGKGRFPVAQSSSNASSPMPARHTPAISSPLIETANESEDDEDEHARARRSLVNATARAADPSPLTQPLESPFFDPSDVQVPISPTETKPNPYAAMSASVRNERPRRGERGPGDLSAIIEEAAKRASQDPEHEGIGGKRDQSPFSDVYRTG